MDSLSHYGTPRRSGRYPWGSGKNNEQRNSSFLARVDELKKQGLSEVKIAEGLGMTTAQLRARKSIAKAEQKKSDIAMAIRLKDKGYSKVAIGERMGINESSVRSLLSDATKERNDITIATANMLKENVDKYNYVDVGVGVERHLGISRTKLKTAITMLEDDGYKIHYIQVEQLGTGKKTSVMVLGKPDSTYSDVYANKDKIKMINHYSEDGGRSFLGLEPIQSINSKRIKIAYDEDGGTEKDGVIELRRGVPDLDLGNSRYAQVRIGVDGTHYMKGMAMYRDDMPPGVDVIYNTNKKRGTEPGDVFKKMKNSEDNPFGATVRQKHYDDKDGKSKLSALNIVNEEGDWDKWSKTLSSQVVSKQMPALAKKQLGLAFKSKQEEFDEINSLTNPIVKKKLLDTFADGCDSAAVHLKAAALPRQKTHVILPFTDMKETEIYAPNYRNGEKVVLIRYPHGGIFEIPELTVNNKHPGANKVIKNAKDAVGINSKVAERLSGADFDGDTVLVIPNNDRSIRTSVPLKGLTNFDPKIAYKAYDGMPKIKPKTKQQLMGDVSNLITDMTIQGASNDELARAVRHSMVVIDAEKHHLNYKQSYIDNNIASLKKRYQGSERSGASTLISRASSEKRVGNRKESIDPATGKKVYEYTGETFKDHKGNTHLKTIKSTKMAEVDDAFKLSSGTIMETVYATHANKLKALGNQARKESVSTKPIPYSPSAKKTYAKEVSSLNSKLNIALMNAPLERQAQILANSRVKIEKQKDPNMDADSLKKLKGQALAEARSRMQAKKTLVEITDKEWEAIQSGAVTTNTLTQILNNTDLDKVKQLATPRKQNGLSNNQESRINRLLKAGYTQAEVADALGISTSVITDYVN